MVITGLLITTFVAALVAMSVAFGVAYGRKRLDTVDAAWGLVFVIVASLVAGYQWQVRTVLIALLVDIWAIRLTNHLWERSRKGKEDSRYVELAKKWPKQSYWLQAYGRVFVVQAILAWVISLPVVLAAGKSGHYAVPLMVLGGLVWLKGFVVEFMADRQLAAFLADKNNKGHVMQSGLWRYSRHPNYYGEITQWAGIAVIACGARYGWIGLVGPLVLAGTIIFVSGIPPIEKAKSNNPEYQTYKRRTSALILWPPKG